MSPELKNILFIDIETVAMRERHSQLNERFKVLWARKAAILRRPDGETDEDLFVDRAGIYAEFGKIIVIAVGKYVDGNGAIGLKTKCFANDDEKTLLLEFSAMLEKMEPNTKLCAHNGKEFDFPFLSRRMLVNGILLPNLLNHSGKKSWDVPHLDTMEMWKFGDYKHYTSLDLLLALFDIPSSKGVIDGSKVREVYYQEKNLTKIADYCLGDVIAIAQLFLKMKNLPLVEEKNMVHSI